jgi:hypothetical protein
MHVAVVLEPLSLPTLPYYVAASRLPCQERGGAVSRIARRRSEPHREALASIGIELREGLAKARGACSRWRARLLPHLPRVLDEPADLHAQRWPARRSRALDLPRRT